MSKYLAALLHVAIVMAGAVGAAVAAPRDLSLWLQLSVVAAGAVVTYLVPLADKAWQGWMKVVFGAIVPGVIAAALPFIPTVGSGFDPQNLLPLIVAVLSALGAQIGIDHRVDSAPAEPPAPFVQVVTSAQTSAVPPVTPADPAQPAAGTQPADG